MKNAMNIKKILIIVAGLGLTAPLQAESLLEVYQQALQSDPRIHEAEARRLAALEAEPQARSLYLPQIDADASWQRDDSSGSSLFEDTTGLPVSIDTETDGETTRWQVGLRQTIFRWDQIVGIQRADKIVAKAEADREAAQQDLIIRVGQAYFDVLAAEDRLTSLHANRQAIARQLEQAKQRFEVGLIAITDVQESQAAYDQAVADEIGAKRVLATARNRLQEITGQYVGELSARGDVLPLR
jgi:outer membrane protein